MYFPFAPQVLKMITAILQFMHLTRTCKTVHIFSLNILWQALCYTYKIFYKVIATFSNAEKHNNLINLMSSNPGKCK